MKKRKTKTMLLNAEIVSLDILLGILIFILAVVTSPFWLFLGLCSILVEMYANCRASLDYEAAMKELRERKEEK